MSRLRVLIAAFLVGMAAALAAEVAAGLLLYVTDGLLGAVTVVLGVGLGAMGLGLASAPAPGTGPVGTAVLLRRWFVALAAFGAAAVLSIGWSLSEGAPEAALSRGLMLALLEALPLYAIGALVGTMGVAHPTVRVGATSVLGAATGVVLEGAVLLARVEPFSIYLFGIVLLSAAALIEGRSLAEPPPGAPALDDEAEGLPRGAGPGLDDEAALPAAGDLDGGSGPYIAPGRGDP